MFNVGLSELLVFAVIAVLVLGPDKLPQAARFAGKTYSKFKRMMSSVQHEIDRELRLSELQSQMQQELERIQQLEQRMQSQMDTLQMNTLQMDALQQQPLSSQAATKTGNQAAYQVKTPHPLCYSHFTAMPKTPFKAGYGVMCPHYTSCHLSSSPLALIA